MVPRHTGAETPEARPVPGVTWDAILSDLRRALPPGTAIRVHAGGVTVDILGERPRVFPSADAALDWATAPAA
jgi:hypothetical protein